MSQLNRSLQHPIIPNLRLLKADYFANISKGSRKDLSSGYSIPNFLKSRKLRVCSLLCMPLHWGTIQYMIHTLLLTILLLSPSNFFNQWKAFWKVLIFFFFQIYFDRKLPKDAGEHFLGPVRATLHFIQQKLFITVTHSSSIQYRINCNPKSYTRSQNLKKAKEYNKELSPPLYSYRQICSIWNRHFFVVFSHCRFKEIFALITKIKILFSI